MGQCTCKQTQIQAEAAGRGSVWCYQPDRICSSSSTDKARQTTPAPWIPLKKHPWNGLRRGPCFDELYAKSTGFIHYFLPRYCDSSAHAGSQTSFLFFFILSPHTITSSQPAHCQWFLPENTWMYTRFYTSHFCQFWGINAYTSSGTICNNQCVFLPKFALGKVNRTYGMIATDCKPSTELLTKGGERRQHLCALTAQSVKAHLKLWPQAHTYFFVSFISSFLKPDFWNIQGRMNPIFFCRVNPEWNLWVFKCVQREAVT